VPDFLLTLDISIESSPLATFSRRKVYLRKHQRQLTNRRYCLNRWIGKQPTIIAIEHKLQETSQKCGETCSSLEAKIRVGSDMTTVKISLEVFSEVRQGNRQKRQPLVFVSPRDGVNVAGGARATPGRGFGRDLIPE
jgi:hypothetical protein